MAERLRDLQDWTELESAPEIALPVDLEEVLRHYCPQETKDVLGPNLLTLLDGNGGTAVSQHSSATCPGPTLPYQGDWAMLWIRGNREIKYFLPYQ